MVIQAGSVYYRRSSGFLPSRRVISPRDIRGILHIEHRFGNLDPRHRVQLSLANRDILLLFDAGTNGDNADWFVELLRMHLDAPAERKIN